MVTSSASQKRAALLATTSSTGWSAVGDALIILRTSAVAACCSCASCSSRVSRATWVSWPEAEELLWRTTLRVFALRLRALVSLLLALERRRIAHPKGLGLRRFSKWDYSRDLRPVEWGSGGSLHGSNPEPLMSALGQKQTLAKARLMSALPPKADMVQRRPDVRYV